MISQPSHFIDANPYINFKIDYSNAAQSQTNQLKLFRTKIAQCIVRFEFIHFPKTQVFHKKPVDSVVDLIYFTPSDRLNDTDVPTI